jgi:CheY-like chemotaxis protein
VEDDDDSREILAHALTLEGATVTAVSAAREALARLPKADIVLTSLCRAMMASGSSTRSISNPDASRSS